MTLATQQTHEWVAAARVDETRTKRGGFWEVYSLCITNAGVLYRGKHIFPESFRNSSLPRLTNRIQSNGKAGKAGGDVLFYLTTRGRYSIINHLECSFLSFFHSFLGPSFPSSSSDMFIVLTVADILRLISAAKTQTPVVRS